MGESELDAVSGGGRDRPVASQVVGVVVGKTWRRQDRLRVSSYQLTAASCSCNRDTFTNAAGE